jgi:hypothetical protein
MICKWFGLKTTRTILSGLASKLVATVFSSLALKLVAMVSPGLASKPVIVFLLSLKIKVVEGFSVWASKPAALDGFLVCASKSSGFRFVGYTTKPTEGGWRRTRVEI